MEVMTRIEPVFVDSNLVQGLKKNKKVEVIHKGKTATWMTNLSMVYPVFYDVPVVLSLGVLGELVPQVISVPHDPSSLSTRLNQM